jgi:hypothetical protein
MMLLTDLTGIAQSLSGAADTAHRQLGILKLLIQSAGVQADRVSNIPFDNAGLYLTLRDELTKTECPVYAHRSPHGLQITRRSTAFSNWGRPMVLEFERPYKSFDQPVDGVAFRDICNIEYAGHLSLTANHGCIYFASGTACKFCSIPAWRDASDRSISRLAKAVRQSAELGEIRHISITTGTSPGSDRGIKSIMAVLNRIALMVPDLHVPIFAEFEPPDDIAWLDGLRDAGIATVACNLEFLSPIHRRNYMPGKAAISFDKYLRIWERCVDLFGRDQVYSNVLMVDPDSDLRASWQAVDEMVAIGVIPSPGILYPDPGSQLADLPIPSVHSQIGLIDAIADSIITAGLDPTRALAGCHRNGAYSAINQFYLDHWLRRDMAKARNGKRVDA